MNKTFSVASTPKKHNTDMKPVSRQVIKQWEAFSSTEMNATTGIISTFFLDRFLEVPSDFIVH